MGSFLDTHIYGAMIKTLKMSFFLAHFWLAKEDQYTCTLLTQFMSGHLACQTYLRYHLRILQTFLDLVIVVQRIDPITYCGAWTLRFPMHV